MNNLKYLGYILVLSVTMINVLPLLISLLICWKEKNCTDKLWKYMMAAVFCGCIQLCSFIVIHKFFYGYWNFLRTIRHLIALDFTYQDIFCFPVSLVARSGIGLITGYFFRYFCCLKGKRPRRLSRKRVAAIFASFSAIGIIATGALYYSFSGIEHLVINEVAGNNVNLILDDTGVICDYIEIYNKGYLPCEIEDLYLSDNHNHLKQKKIPKSVIPAQGYLVVKLEDDSLRLRKEGGDTVYLSNIWGKILDQVSVAGMEADFSYCRENELSDNWTIRSSTPGDANGNGIARLQTPPAFSHSSGFYQDAFDLQITAKDGEVIYYTLDGSIPTTNSEVYTQPIRVYNRSHEPNVWRSQQRVVYDWENYTPDPTPVDKAFVVRAIAVDGEGAVSRPVTATYFVDLEKYKQSKVVSLVVDPEDFWGEDGIHVTGKRYDAWYLGDRAGESPLGNFIYGGRIEEKPAYFIYLSEDKMFEQNIGIRIAGASSRAGAQKSFSLYSREIYSGSSIFDTNIFENTKSEKLKIRGGYANAICQLLVPDRSFGTQQVQRVSVFLNGEFWYNANILEKYDSRYFSEHYGVNPNNVVVMKQGELNEGLEGDELLLNEVYDYLSSRDLSDNENYAGFAEIIDMQSYIDYMCFNIYIDNMDFREDKNSLWWRSREITAKPYEDGKWRFLAYDLDAMEWGDAGVWGLKTQAEKNSFTLIPRYNREQPINQQPIFAALKKNPAFVQQFVLTFMDMVNTNFRYENVQSVLEAYGPVGENYHGGKGTGYYEEFFQTRASYIVPYMAEEFSLNGTLETLCLEINDSEAGYIRLNTIIPDLSGENWCGQYYTDYPVTVTAVAAEGYVFKGWSGSVKSTDASMEVKLSTGGTSLYAVFEKQMP